MFITLAVVVVEVKLIQHQEMLMGVSEAEQMVQQVLQVIVLLQDLQDQVDYQVVVVQ